MKEPRVEMVHYSPVKIKHRICEDVFVAFILVSEKLGFSRTPDTQTAHVREATRPVA